jgi:chaperonin GroES
MAKLRPLADRVIVESVEEDAVTKAGIVLPDTAEKEKPEKGKVVAVGPGKMLDNGSRAMMSVKVGDVIIFKKYGPDEVKVDGKEILVLEESDIIAVVE